MVFTMHKNLVRISMQQNNKEYNGSTTALFKTKALQFMGYSCSCVSLFLREKWSICIWFPSCVQRNVVHTYVLGDSRKYPYPTTGSIFIKTPPCLRKFQNAQSPLALRNSIPFYPPHLRNSIIIQTPPSGIFSFPSNWFEKTSLTSKHLH